MKQPEARKQVAKILKKKLKNSNGWVGLAKNINPKVQGRVYAKSLVLKFLASHAKKQPKKSPTKEKLNSKDFYESREWRRVRYAVLKKHGARCLCCGRSPNKHGIVVHVDHIKPRSKFPELELNPNNLQILCEDCNLGKSNLDSTDWRRPKTPSVVRQNRTILRKTNLKAV